MFASNERNIKVTIEADLEVPHKRCRQCGAYVPEIEIERNLCVDCNLENHKLRKKKGYANAEREHAVDHDV